MWSLRVAISIGLFLPVTAGFATSGTLVGKRAPDAQLRDQDGQPIQLSSFRGKQSLVLAFYHSGT